MYMMRTWWVVAVAVTGAWGLPGATAQERGGEEQRLVNILEGLEHGLVALEHLGLREEHDRLRMVADDVRGELRFLRRRGGAERGPQTELQIVEGQVGALQLALPALREAERRDAAEMIERAIAARQAALERARDPEGRRGRDRSPNREQIVEILVMAEHIYREFGMNERADMLSRQTEELWPRRDRERVREREHARERNRDHERPPDARREAAMRDLEIMHLAMAALKEKGRHDSAELLHRAIRAREVRLEGRRDREAIEIHEQAPTLGQQIELLAYAADLWEEFGHERKAEMVGGLAARMRESWQRGEGRRGEGQRQGQRRGGEQRRNVPPDRIEQLERRLAEIEQALEETREQLRAARRQQR
jgi:hypothetical protein